MTGPDDLIEARRADQRRPIPTWALVVIVLVPLGLLLWGLW